MRKVETSNVTSTDPVVKWRGYFSIFPESA
jgi:hypothetical protein